MEIDKAIGLIEAHGVFHGDHYTVTVHREWLDRKNETIVS